MRATYIRAGCCESGRSRGKEIAKIMFDSFVNKTGWKLILSQNVGKFLDVVVKANPGIIELLRNLDLDYSMPPKASSSVLPSSLLKLSST